MVDLVSRLDAARKDLLDLTARNRLLHTAIGKSKGKNVAVVEELSEQVFQILVRDKKSMSFLPGRESSDTDTESDADEESAAFTLSQPEEPSDGNGLAERYSDSRLQTALSSEGLQRRLLGIFYDA